MLRVFTVCCLLALSAADIEDRVSVVDPCSYDPSMCPEEPPLDKRDWSGDRQYEGGLSPTDYGEYEGGLTPTDHGQHEEDDSSLPPPSPTPVFACFVPFCLGCDQSAVSRSAVPDGGTFTVTCDVGFELVGDALMTCRRELGGWDHEPECKPSDLGPTTTTGQSTNTCTKPSLENAKLVYPAEKLVFEDGDFAFFECNDREEGEHADFVQLVCEGNDQWSGEKDGCRDITTEPTTTTTQAMTTTPTGLTCAPPVVENGELMDSDQQAEGFYRGQVVRVRCNDREDGEHANFVQLVCEGNDQWSGEKDGCRDITTEPTTTTTQATTMTPTGLTCAPPVVENGELMDSDQQAEGFYRGQVVRVRCKEGYLTIIGYEDKYTRPSFTLRCKKNGKWAGKRPVCQAFKCESPIVTSRVVVKVRTGEDKESYDHGDTVFFLCQGKFQELVGNTETQCDMASYGWTRRPPVCRDTRCMMPRWPANGRLHGQTGSVGDTITAFCSEDFTLSGSEVRTCLANGTWSGTRAACQLNRFTCPDPGFPDGGYREGDTFKEGDQVRYSCDHNYIMFGATVHTCLASGSWSHPPTKCVGPDEFSDPKTAAKSIHKLVKHAESHQGTQIRDVVFFVDVSDSVSKELLEAQKNFFSNLTLKFKSVPLTVIAYNETAETVVQRADGHGVRSSLATINHTGGTTSFKDAFRLGHKSPLRPSMFIIVTNDAMDQNGRITKMLGKRNRIPTMCVIGIGGHVDRLELSLAVKLSRSRPLEEHLFFLKSNSDLEALVGE